MSFLNNLLSGGGGYGGNRRISLDTGLKNVLIAGASPNGANNVMKSYAIDALNKGYGVILFRNQSSILSAYPNIVSSDRMVHSLMCEDDAVTDGIDILAGMNDNEATSLLIDLFDMYNDFDKSKKMSYQSYIALLKFLAHKAGKKVTIETLADIGIEDLEAWNMRYCNGIEQSRNERFLNSIRMDIWTLESYFRGFSGNMIGTILSGNNSLEQIFNYREVVEIELDFSSKSKEKESTLIMHAILNAILRFNFSASRIKDIRVIVDSVPNESLIESGMARILTNRNNIHLVLTVQDISNLLKGDGSGQYKGSNVWVDYSDSFFFFRQNSEDNKNFCSAFFGTYEKKEKSYTTMNPGFLNWATGKQGKSVTTSKKEEAVFKPEDFAALKDMETIFYSKENNFHQRLLV